jgi:hypothetical protein
MRASRIIKVSIARPYDEVYDFFAEPLNFTRWAANPDSTIEALDGGEWLVDLPRGPSTIRFTPRNPYGVLDYQVSDLKGNKEPVVPVRLYPNEDGCDLVLVWLQRDGISDARFASDAEWVQSDLERAKALIEARTG